MTSTHHPTRPDASRGRRGRSRFRALAAVLAIATGVGACDALDDLFSVDAPGVVDADDLTTPENAHLLVSGTIADFECALGAYIVNSALLGNELRDASVTASRFPLDQRIIHDASPYGVNSCNGNPPGIYGPLATAIWTSNNAIESLQAWSDAEVDNRNELIGQAAAYSGYSHVLMGEGFCSTVIVEDGPEVSPQQVFEAAVARFTTAINAAQSAGDVETRNLALLGRARAQLNLGADAAAASDARAVLASDPAFRVEASASTAASRRWNRVGAEFFGGNVTVDPSFRDLTVGGEPDVRVEIIDTETDGHDSATPVFLAAKYGTTRSASLREQPVPVATWREAHLIIAEAEGGQEAIDRINVLRDHWGLPRYTPASVNEAEIQQQIIEERARELFLEGHHLNDLRRFNLAQTPAPGTTYRQGGVYGDVRCFPLPAVERTNNPSLN